MCKMNCRHHLFSICYFYFRRSCCCCCCCPVIWLNVIFPSLLFCHIYFGSYSVIFFARSSLSLHIKIYNVFLLSPNQVFSLSKPHRVDIYGQKNCGMCLCAVLKESLTNFSRYSIFLSQYNGNDCGGQHLLKQNIKAARFFFLLFIWTTNYATDHLWSYCELDLAVNFIRMNCSLKGSR